MPPIATEDIINASITPTGQVSSQVMELNTMPGPDYDWKISLKNKIIAITGANRGIGLGVAEVCLANDAACVYSLDLFEPGEEFQAVAKAFGPKKFTYINCDVTDEASVNNAIETIVAQKGRIDGLVANAGMVGGSNHASFLADIRTMCRNDEASACVGL